MDPTLPRLMVDSQFAYSD